MGTPTARDDVRTNPKKARTEMSAERKQCERCAGTGQFITGSMNGKPTGPGGICFRCGGKGHQTDADERRNYGYDIHAASEAMRQMLG
jgi:DnaJ-class molecular chaperone